MRTKPEGAAIVGEKSLNECQTLNSVGNETFEDTHLDATNDRTHLTSSHLLKQETMNEFTDPVDKTMITDDVTEFLMEVNSLNNNLLSRKNSIQQQIAELKKELEMLEQTKSTPAAIARYINNQRNLRTRIEHALKTGSTKFNPKIKAAPLPNFAKNDGNQGMSYPRVPPNEAVFVTEKTEGYKKEQEKLKHQKQRKRDLKMNNKMAQEDSHFASDEPLPGYLDHDTTPFDCDMNGLDGLGFDNDEFDNLGMSKKRISSLFNGPSSPDQEISGKNLNPELDKSMVKSSQLNHNINSDLSKNGGRRLGADGFRLPSSTSDDFHGDRKRLGKMAESPGQGPFETFKHLSTGNDYSGDSHPTETKDVKNEVDESNFDPFAENSHKNLPKLPKDFDPNDEKELFGDSDSELSEDNNKLDSIFENPANQDGTAKAEYDPAYPNYEEGMQGMGPMGEAGYMQHPVGMIATDQMDEFGYDPGYYGPQNCYDGMYPPAPMDPSMYKMGEMGYPYMPESAEFYKNYQMGKAGKFGHRMNANKGRKRNKYRMLPTDIKREAVDLARRLGCKQAASHMNVPLKSLKRWMKVGCERKKGGGRKTKDPLMEKNLYQWYLNMKSRNMSVTAKMIKEKAIELTNCEDFIASKGWLDKFKVRYSLDISKETTKEHGRRPKALQGRKQTERYGEGANSDPFFNKNDDTLQSYRRSINKTMKNEIKNESDLRGEPSNSSSKIKSELFEGKAPGKDCFKPKTEICSIFQNHNKQTAQAIKPSSHLISIPLSDGSDLDFAG